MYPRDPSIHPKGFASGQAGKNIMQDHKQEILDFDAIRLRVASPEAIKSWSHGEVIRPETINYRTQKPEKDGLFCEKIFGPMKDWECYCGKYKKIRYKGIVCDKCGVEVTRSLVRRERMRHIELATPISHIWFLKGVPSKIGLILDMSASSLEKVIYFANFIVVKVDEELRQAALEQLESEFKAKKKQIEASGNNKINQIKSNTNLEEVDKQAKIKEIEEESELQTKELVAIADITKKELKDLKVKQILSESAYQDLALKYGHIFEASIGAEAVHQLLKEIDLLGEIKNLDKELETASTIKKRKLMKRYKLLKNFKERDVKPDWMIMTHVPVMPPDLRPMVALDGGRFAASDLNDLYRRVINRNNRLKKLLVLTAPEVIVRNEKRMLQEAVDALIDNSARHGKTVTASTGQKRTLKSLADSLKGKQGRFRQNLLGKRVDYSGRSVIVVGPKLKIHQCGLPKKMALELFKPFVISKLIGRELAHNVRSANRYIEGGHTEVYDILEEVIAGAHVFLNRAPTLHRLGIQAFKPVLIEGKAIQLHPMVCAAFNADFDGDQMAVHVPLTKEANQEASQLMLASKNLLKPGDGSPVTTPAQDLVLGIYYLTNCHEENEYLEENKNKTKKKLKFFSSEKEAIMAYQLKAISLQDQIKVRFTDDEVKNWRIKPEEKLFLTTVGRVIFNQILPEKIKYLNKTMNKSSLKNIITSSLEFYGEEKTAELLDDIKDISVKYLTASGISWAISDLPKLENKPGLIKKADAEIDDILGQYEMGLLTNDERKTKAVKVWFDVIDKVTESCRESLSKIKNNPVYAMIESASRGSWNQTNQMMGIKGLVNNPSGETIELPIKASFKEGFGVLEYFSSTHGARKGLSDTALRTAGAGYMTRKLIDVCQSVVITEDDCGDIDGILITKKESEEMGESVVKRILGRVILENIKDPETKKIIVKKGATINHEISRKLEKIDIESVKIRSVLTCKTKQGLCVKCYGWDLGHNKMVRKGMAVGIVAAQSIGEPGTQLTMRTFHTGGVAQGGDITQGLPRVEEIFEARSIKKPALLSPINGKLILEDMEDNKQKIIKIEGYEIKSKEVKIPIAKVEDLLVKDKEKVKKDQVILEDKKYVIKVPFASKFEIKEKNEKNWIIAFVAKKKVVKELPATRSSMLWVKDGEELTKGQQLSEGSVDIKELFELRGKEAVQTYVMREIQSIYSSQGQKLNDKHVGIIAKQMFSRVFITDSGDSSLAPGETVEIDEFALVNEALEEAGKKTAEGNLLLLGITKASLSTSSFLSAASFQETARILIDAAVSGRVDHLRGLKENVIIGRLIPAGTGLKKLEEEE